MIPSYKWFPMSLAERAGWYRNFNNHIQVIGASLGLNAAELDLINKDTENIIFIAQATVSLEAYMAAMRQYRKSFTEGHPGDPTPVFPISPTLTLPHPNQPTGAFDRLDKIVRRVRAAAAFTDATEALLGIDVRRPERAAIGESAPELRASARPGNLIEIKFIRGSSQGINVEINADDSGWTDAGRFFKSPAVFAVAPSENGAPRNVLIRARYLDGNKPVGEFSPMPRVQTIP